ncbi:zf-HC2 domain-containing protein [Allostreptomyces psammosilenae]|uniref:Putative zinc-finger domain-containing protein n=1 Tax=Allostreptomyces psammosilenae TaxID=1892865 RepID=A0A853AB72_9ACTN|nr:zf-HC2 domain-containing protein [Allostreptomyces psammosilenae]NYI07748.1 hypothetical protein [Allostreptomyces psammosilenae]
MSGLPDRDHEYYRTLLGAWAVDACAPEETLAVESHLTGCVPCRQEALRLRDAAGWLTVEDTLEPSPELRGSVLERCLARRPARHRLPSWAAGYGAEAARLDALLRDLPGHDWLRRVRTPWPSGAAGEVQWSIADVLCHLSAGDGLVARALGLPDPLDASGSRFGNVSLFPSRRATAGAPASAGPTVPDAPAPADPTAPDAPAPADPDGTDGTGRAGPAGPAGPASPTDPVGGARTDPRQRTELLIAAEADRSDDTVRDAWREQTRAVLQAVGLAGHHVGAVEVEYGTHSVPLRDALVARAFACWIHGTDIAAAVSYPYPAPEPAHLRQLAELGLRLLPGALEHLIKDGRATPRPGHYTTVHLTGAGLRRRIPGAPGGTAALAGPDDRDDGPLSGGPADPGPHAGPPRAAGPDDRADAADPADLIRLRPVAPADTVTGAATAGPAATALGDPRPPAGRPRATGTVELVTGVEAASLTMDVQEFCLLLAGRRTPQEAAALIAVDGDRDAAHDLLRAAARVDLL